MSSQSLPITGACAAFGQFRRTSRRRSQRALCALVGHDVGSTAGTAANQETVCRCGAAILAEDGRETRIRHNVSCFVFGHRYVRMGERHNHNEYACVCCGHPLLFRVDSDPYAQEPAFRKKVRYFCNLFGHHVHRVAERGDFTEYACACGHSFLKANQNLATITHPLVCLLAGHFVRFVERRQGFAEHLCRNCGHTFCLAVR